MTPELEQKVREAFSNPKQVLMTSCGYGFNVVTSEKALEYVLNEKNNYDGERCFSIKSLSPYKDLHEFTVAQDAHSKYICFKDYPDGLKLPIEINNKGIYVKWFDGMQFVSYADLAERCTWQDGYPCGILGDEHEYIINKENNESLENITVLGDGTFAGKLSAHDFVYNGKHYYSEVGIKGIVPVSYTVTIKDGKQVV